MGKLQGDPSGSNTLAAAVAADGSSGGFIKDSEAGQLPATATNDNAAAGKVGELLSSTVLIGAAVSLTHATAANVTSLALTAGDWDVWFDAHFSGGATTNVWYLVAGISATTATLPTAPGTFAANYVSPDSFAIFNIGFNEFTANVGPLRISLASTTTYYGVVQAGFSTSTMLGHGIMRARRVR